MGAVKATVGVVDRRVLRKHHFPAFVGLSHSLDAPDRVFSLFSTFEWQLALEGVTRETKIRLDI